MSSIRYYVYDNRKPCDSALASFGDRDDACLFARAKAAHEKMTNGCDLNVLFGKLVPDDYEVTIRPRISR